MYQLRLYFIAFLWVSGSSAWGLFSNAPEMKKYEETASAFHFTSEDLADQLNEVVLTSDHKKALTKLVELQSKPTCSRQAASRLMVSCASLNGIKDETSRGKADFELEDIRNAYAVSLAICQFDQAGIDTPESCMGFSSSPIGNGNRGGLAKKTRSEKDQLKSCLNSLYLDGSAWTTFTENHQTARIICEASRVHDERDRMIEVYKRRADVDSTRTNHYFEELDSFIKSFDIARSQMAADVENANKESRTYFESLQRQFSQFTSELAEKLSDQFSDASVAAETLVRTVARGEAELVATQRGALELSREMVLGAHTGQESAVALQIVLQQVVDVVRDLQVQVAEIKEHNIAIDERSRGALVYMQNITSQLEVVNALQEENIERALFMAKIQDEAAESARYWSSWLRFLGLPTWQEVIRSDFRVLGIRWQVLFGCLSSSLLGGNYGLDTTVKTNFLLLGGGFMASGFITILENAFWSLFEAHGFSEQPTIYDLVPTISIRTTPIVSSSQSALTSYETYGKHPHGEVRR